jgi:hypothetical protein
METIDFKDLQESNIRTNDGNRQFNVINGVYKGSTVIYSTISRQWTLIIKKDVNK